MLATINTALERMYMALNPVFRSERAASAKQLEEFRNRDFRSMGYELGRLFPADKDLMSKGLRYCDLTAKACSDLAIQYDVPPMRRFVGVSETQAERWTQVYADLGVNDALALGEQQTVAQQSMVYGVWPDTKGRLRITRFLPGFQVEQVSFDDPWAAAGGDLQDAAQVVLCRSAFHPGDAYQPGPTSQFVARVTLTRDEAYITLPDGVRHGLFSDDMRNPLGFVPLAGTRRALPIDDVDWIPELSQDLSSVHIGTNLGMTDWEHLIRQDGPKTVYATGMGAKLLSKDTVKKLAGGIIPIPSDTTLVPLDASPPIDKYIMAIDRSVALFAQFRNLRPEGYSGLTGSAKQVDRYALEQERLKQENRLRQLERSLTKLIARVHVLTQRSALTLEEPRVDVSYVYPRMRENVLQEAQALPILMAMGLGDAVDEIVANEKVTEAEAERRWLKRMERWREMVSSGVMQVPGLDKIANQLDKNGAKAPTSEPAKTEAKTEPTPPTLAGEGDVQKTALNGAQVTALQGVVESVARGELPLEAAREVILASFPIAPADVDKMLAPLRNFTPAKESSNVDVDQGRGLEKGS